MFKISKSDRDGLGDFVLLCITLAGAVQIDWDWDGCGNGPAGGRGG